MSAQTPAYFTQYDNLNMTRGEDGVLVVALHTKGGPMIFGNSDHQQLGRAFYDIGQDRDNKVVIMTGTGGH